MVHSPVPPGRDLCRAIAASGPQAHRGALGGSTQDRFFVTEEG
jgi:hypothetical protein